MLALFGGTFDPVHLGHMETVAQLQKDLKIDQIRWVLSAKPPHRSCPSATIEQRLAMLDIALADYDQMFSDDVEVRRDKASYTIDTLEYFRQQSHDASIILIIGSDIMSSFDQWHRYQDIFKVANIIIMHRAGHEQTSTNVFTEYLTKDWNDLRLNTHGYVYLYPAPSISISATQVREAIASQLPDGKHELADWLHPKVLTFIQQNNLYA